MVHYIDTSALVKLVVGESETPALTSWVASTTTDLLSSDLARTELIRAVRRVAPDRVVLGRAVLESITLVSITTGAFEAAGHLDPMIPRTRDALHLAVALDLGDDLAGIVTYDDRLADAARAHGISVLSPT